MSRAKSPGQSNARTPAKHDVMNKVVDALAGMATRPGVCSRFPGGQVMVDMTAGDIIGGPSGHNPATLFDASDIQPDADASHAILVRHAEFTARMTGQPARVFLFERKAKQAARLREFYATRPYVVVTAGLSQERLRHVVPVADRGSLVLVDDPNSTGSSTLTPEVVDWAFGWAGTTLIACIGANAGGVMQTPGLRESSRERYQAVLDAGRAQGGRFAAAARLVNDSHRWGYLVITTASAERSVRQAIDRMHGRTSFLVEPAYGFAHVERLLDALHRPARETA